MWRAEILTVDDRSLELLEIYQNQKILNSRCQNDMLHIALATVAKVDVLISWNFKHIVRFDNNTPDSFDVE